MRRYFSSFFIALTLYILIGIGIFYLYKNNKVEVIEKTKTSQTISLNHIELKPQINKVEEEPIIEKKLDEIKKPSSKESIIKEPIAKKEIKKKVEKKQIEKIIETPNPNPNPIKNEVVKEKTIQRDIQKPIVDEKKVYLDKYLAQIRDLINQNIQYPSRAKKLSIEGMVIVQFTITQNGSVENIVIIEGHKFLQTSTIEAINEASKSFPKTEQNIEIQIPIEYKLI